MTVQAGTTFARVLICDDAPGELAAMSQLLGRHGFAITRTSEGEGAIEALKSEQIDLLLLDICMPDARVDGFGVLRYVREHRKALPVIILTGLDPLELQQHMHAAHITELPIMLLKPINPSRLVELVQMHCQPSDELAAQSYLSMPQ